MHNEYDMSPSKVAIVIWTLLLVVPLHICAICYAISKWFIHKWLVKK